MRRPTPGVYAPKCPLNESMTLENTIALFALATLAACGAGQSQDNSPTAESSASGTSPAKGFATLSWSAPGTKADGSALQDLAGFRVYVGTTSGVYAAVITISDPAVTSYSVSNLSAGTYYFVIKAFDKNNVESAPSSEVSKTIS